MAKETGLTKAMIISTLTKSVHAGGAAKRTKGSKLPKLTPDQKIDAQIARLRHAGGLPSGAGFSSLSIRASR